MLYLREIFLEQNVVAVKVLDKQTVDINIQINVGVHSMSVGKVTLLMISVKS